jgi:hypothetical protein
MTYKGQIYILHGSTTEGYKQNKNMYTTTTATTTTNNNNIHLRVQLIVYCFKYGALLRDCVVSETLFRNHLLNYMS